MRRSGIYRIGPSRERLRPFFFLGIVLTSPQLRRDGLEFHSKLLKSGGLFASRQDDATANAKPGFLTVDSKPCALRPINGT